MLSLLIIQKNYLSAPISPGSKSRTVQDIFLKFTPERLVKQRLILAQASAKKTDKIDPAVGIIVHKKVGDKIEKGDVLFTIFANDAEQGEGCRMTIN